jgi:hypothetical protein
VARRGGGRSDQRISASAQRPAPHAALSPGLFAAAGPAARAGAAPRPSSGPSARSPRPAYTVTGASGARLLADWSDARAARALRQGALAHSRSEPAARTPQRASAGPGEGRPAGPGMAAGPPGLPPGPSSTLGAEPAEGAARAASRGGSGPVSEPRPHAAVRGSVGNASVAAPAPTGGGGDGRRRSQDHGATLSAVTGAGMLRELQELQARGGPPGGSRREGRSGDAWTVGGGAARGALGRALGVGTLGSASDVLASGRLAGGPLRRGGPRPAPGVPRGGGPGGLGALIAGGFARVSGAFTGPAAAGRGHARGEPGHAPGVQPAGGRAGGRAAPSPPRHSSLMDLFAGSSAGLGDGAIPLLPPPAADGAQTGSADGPGSHASGPGPHASGTDVSGILRAGSGSGAAAPRPRSVRFADPGSDAGHALPRLPAASDDQAPRGAAAVPGVALSAERGPDLESGSGADVGPVPGSHFRSVTGTGSAPPVGGVSGEAQHAARGQPRSAPLAFDIVVDP